MTNNNILKQKTTHWLMALISVLMVSVLVSGCGTAAPTANPAAEAASNDAVSANPAAEAASNEAVSAEEPASTTAEPVASFYNEAPDLAEQVTAGKLPPVDERLPTNPMILESVEQIGVYGGTWRRGMRGNRDQASLIRTLGYENLMRWDEQWTRVIPNVVQSVDINENATEFTFHLREGMRWSDGAPFTADDILFWYEAIYSNEAFPGAAQSWLFGDKAGLVVEKIDETTVTFHFETTQSENLYSGRFHAALGLGAPSSG